MEMDSLLSDGTGKFAGFCRYARSRELSGESRQLIDSLLGLDQSHLFEDWPHDDGSSGDAFLDQLRGADRSYPGGLTAYITNARALLKEAVAGTNPFEGLRPEQPDMVDLSTFGDAYDAAERIGLEAFSRAAVVLVAGGLGERLGFSGIKLDIPVEVTTGTTYLAHYADVLKALSRRCGKAVPLVIMTSLDTHDATVAALDANDHFGLPRDAVSIVRQELVPALSDVDAHLALQEPCRLQLKPHGHGDIHMLLHSSGQARDLADRGVEYLLFIQDTNGQVFNGAIAALGTSVQQGYDFNSIAVKRIPGEAVGGLARLVSEDGRPPLTLNVEYNQLDPLLRATVSPEGDVADAHGFSLFPGNINVLLIRLQPYLRVLEKSQGIVAEFVNPKFTDATRTDFKKPTRLETLMQDLPKLFREGEKVGVTILDRSWCFSACKNKLEDAAAKQAAGGPPESASSAEFDFYSAGVFRLRDAGMQVEEDPPTSIHGIRLPGIPRAIIRPGCALTLADLRSRISGGRLGRSATLILNGDVSLANVNVNDGAALSATAPPGSTLTISDLDIPPGESFRIEPLSHDELHSESVPETLRIRGYRIVGSPTRSLECPEAGTWSCVGEGPIERNS